MLADALRSELFKLWRNRTAWFWGFVFVPLVALAIGLFSEVYVRARLPQAGLLPVDIGRQAINAVAQAASPLTVLFVLIAAAILFGGEYRWETWRLLAPRNSRVNLLLAKFLAFAAGAAVTVAGIALAGVVSSLLGAVVSHSPVVWLSGSAGGFTAHLAGQFLISWAQLLQTGAIAALAAVLTRSILAGVIAPIVLGVIQVALAGQPQADPLHPSPWRLLELPGLGANMVRFFVDKEMLPGAVIDPGVAAQATVSLVGWIVVAMAVATVAFMRQDLSKE